MTQSWWVSEPRCLVPWGAAAQQAGEFWACAVRGASGAGQGPVQGLTRAGLPSRRGGGAALQRKGLCALLWHECSWAQLWQQEMLLVHQADASWKSCCVKHLQQVWHLSLQSKAGEGREPPVPQGTVTATCNSWQCLAVQYPLLLAPTFVTSYLEMCKGPALPLESRVTFWWNMAKQKWLCRLWEGEKPRFLLSLQHLAGHCWHPLDWGW